MGVDVEQLSPTSLYAQLAAYQNTIRDLHSQNQHNVELLGQLETIIFEKESEISQL